MQATTLSFTRDHQGVRFAPVVSPIEDEAAALGDAIAELASRIHAATYELLVLIRQFDAHAGWGNGFLSCAHWLNWRTGIDLGAAREKVRVAHALADLPLLSAAMARGQLSYAKVRAVTRVATPANEAQLLAAAQCGTAAHVEKLVRAWRRVDRVVAAQEAERRHQHRQLQTWTDDDGMLVIRGRLAPEVGAVVQRALDAASDRLFRAAPQRPADLPAAEQTSPAQRRADALGLLAECALAADLDGGTAGDRYQVVLHVEGDALRAEAPPARRPENLAAPLADLPRMLPPESSGSGATPVSGLPPSPGSAPVPADTSQAVLADGPCVSAETSRRLACDASVVVMRHAADGSVLDVGRKTRTIPTAIRRALGARDTHCRFPGCTNRLTDAHHVEHWADGGATRLDNLVLLCRRHHRAVHEGGWTVGWDAEREAVFTGPNSMRLEMAPAAPRWRDSSPLAPTMTRLAEVGITIAPTTSRPEWYGERFDVGYAIDVLRQGEEQERRAARVSAEATLHFMGDERLSSRPATHSPCCGRLVRCRQN